MDILWTRSPEYIIPDISGIRMTYGMSIDYLGYSGIAKQYIQRGATLITRKTDGNIDITMVPLKTVISTRVRGA